MGRERRGCETQLARPLQLDPYPVGGVIKFRYEYDFCPVNYVDITHRGWLGLYTLFRKNLLLVVGGVEDQPSKYIDVMQFLDSLWSQHERETIEQASAQHSKPRPQGQPPKKGRLK